MLDDTRRSDAGGFREPPIGRARWLYRVILLGILTFGILLGAWHNFIGVRSLFVFRNGEPLSSWIVILMGPCSTLPATLLTVVRRSWGSAWLIGGGILSLGTIVMTEVANGDPLTDVISRALRYSVTIALPMVLLGTGLLLVHRKLASTDRD